MNSKVSTRKVSEIKYGVVFEAKDRIGNTIYAKEVSSVEEGDLYQISWHRGLMPAHATESYATIEAVAVAMKNITGDLRVWKQVDSE